jgi:DNA-binding beta-propeller fold protein YncE
MKQLLTILFLSIHSLAVSQSNSLIDAAFAWDKDIVYFTRNNTVVKFDNTNNKVLKTSTIAEAFPGVFFTKTDAALDYVIINIPVSIKKITGQIMDILKR